MSVVDMACLLCGGTALGARSATAEIELRCPVCGTYSITVGAVNLSARARRKRLSSARRSSEGTRKATRCRAWTWTSSTRR